MAGAAAPREAGGASRGAREGLGGGDGAGRGRRRSRGRGRVSPEPCASRRSSCETLPRRAVREAGWQRGWRRTRKKEVGGQDEQCKEDPPSDLDLMIKKFGCGEGKIRDYGTDIPKF